MNICPTQAISWKGNKFILPKNEIAEKDSQQKNKKATVLKYISAVLMVLVLLSALFCYNIDVFNQTPNLPDIGFEIGDSCNDMSIKVFDENGENGQTVIPAKTGKITIINFWGTWCGPCVKELPYFEKIATEYKDKVLVVAVHSVMDYEKAAKYVDEHFPDSDIVFAKDEAGANGDTINGAFYASLGGKGTYPYTVILDENGVIKFIEFKAVDYKLLKEHVEELI